MNLFLGQQYKYIVFEPVEAVRSQLKSITATPWYDLSINLAGRVFDDNRFKLYSKLTMGFEAFGTMQHVAEIKGKIDSLEGQTHIDVEVKPNDLVLLVFYIIGFIFLINLAGLCISYPGSNWTVVAASLLLLLFIRSLIYFSMGRLKNRFERTLLVHPEE